MLREMTYGLELEVFNATEPKAAVCMPDPVPPCLSTEMLLALPDFSLLDGWFRRGWRTESSAFAAARIATGPCQEVREGVPRVPLLLWRWQFIQGSHPALCWSRGLLSHTRAPDTPDGEGRLLFRARSVGTPSATPMTDGCGAGV